MVRCVSTRPAKVSTDSDRGKIYIPPRSLPRFFPKKFISLFSCSCNDSSYFFFFFSTNRMDFVKMSTNSRERKKFIFPFSSYTTILLCSFFFNFFYQPDGFCQSVHRLERTEIASLVDANDRRMFFFFFLVSFNFSISWIFSI